MRSRYVLIFLVMHIGLFNHPSFAVAESVRADRITIVDGDTVDIGNDRYRLIGYDTPESRTPGRTVGPKERALAAQAIVRLKQLLSEGEVDLTERPCSCSKRALQDGTCNHGRKCAVLSVNGRNVADTLIPEGLARKWVCGQTRCPRMPDWPRILGDIPQPLLQYR